MRFCMIGWEIRCYLAVFGSCGCDSCDPRLLMWGLEHTIAEVLSILLPLLCCSGYIIVEVSIWMIATPVYVGAFYASVITKCVLELGI